MLSILLKQLGDLTFDFIAHFAKVIPSIGQGWIRITLLMQDSSYLFLLFAWKIVTH